ALSAHGAAAFTITGPRAADHTLAATYPDQVYYAGSSANGTLHVNSAPTTTVLTAPDITYGLAGSVTVTLNSSAGTPTGDVSLIVDGSNVQAHVLASGAWTFTVPGLDAGDHSVAASFATQGNFAAS